MKFIVYDTGNVSLRVSNKEIVQQGNVIIYKYPWSLYSQPIMRKLCHFHLSPKFNGRIKLPLKSIWFGRIFREIEVGSIIVLSAHFYSLIDSDLADKLRRKYKCKIVFSFSDKYDYFKKNYKNFPSMEVIKDSYDAVITYNTIDSMNYDLIETRPQIPNYGIVRENSTLKSSDVFYVGQNKNRIDRIHDIYKKLEAADINCEFFVTNVPLEKQLKNSKIHYNEPISYCTVLQYIKNTKCILNIIQDHGAGITLRDFEALGNDKLMLTDNYPLANAPFYDQSQVIWIDDLPNRIKDIKKGYSKHNTAMDSYNFDNWYKWIENILV